MANILSTLKSLLPKKVDKSIVGSFDSNLKFWRNGTDVEWAAISEDNTAYYLQACPPLTTIINRKAQAFINGKVEVLNFNTDNYVRGRHKEWEKLMRNPNKLQTYMEFMSQVYMYLQAYKYCPILLVRPVGFDKTTMPTEMWVLPPHFLKIDINDKYLYCDSYSDMIDKIYFNYEGGRTELNKDNIFLLRGLGMSIENLVTPDSALTPLKYPIQNLIKNYEARGTIAEKRGAIGILSNTRADSIGSLPMRKGAKEQLQEDYKMYGMGKDQWQLIITDAPLSYQSMTMPVRDMMLLEMEKADVMTIADAFNYPSVLLASEKGTTYSNQEGAKRSFYQDTVVPEAMHIIEQINKMLHTEKNGVKITLDYTWLPILQMDEKLKSQVRRELGLAVIYEFRNNVITWNEMKIALGQDTVAGMDKYFYELPEMYAEQEQQPVNGARVEDPDRQGTIENEGNENEDTQGQGDSD